jgi:hypothetical protein
MQRNEGSFLFLTWPGLWRNQRRGNEGDADEFLGICGKNNTPGRDGWFKQQEHTAQATSPGDATCCNLAAMCAVAPATQNHMERRFARASQTGMNFDSKN